MASFYFKEKKLKEKKIKSKTVEKLKITFRLSSYIGLSLMLWLEISQITSQVIL